MSSAAISKVWTVLLVVYVLFFITGVYPYIRAFHGLGGLLQIAIDLAVIYGLTGFVIKRPLKSVLLRFMCYFLSLILVIRVSLLIYMIASYLLGWQSAQELDVTNRMYFAVPLLLMSSFVLWRYATAHVIDRGSD